MGPFLVGVRHDVDALGSYTFFSVLVNIISVNPC